jgi:hypothetical protein
VGSSMIDKLIEIAKKLDDYDLWSSFWFYPAVAFAVGSLMFMVFGLIIPAGYAVGAAIICITAYFANRLFAKLHKKPEDT